MTYYFDQFGWLTYQPFAGRSTDKVPPTETQTLKANWTGLDWVLVTYTAPPVPVPPPVPVDPCQWLIDHMPFLDRFGPAIKHLFLKSTDADVVALRADYFARKWLDLTKPELQAGFYFMAGVTVPVLGTIATPIVGLTPALVAEKFAIPVDAAENSALRALYF